MDMKVINDIVNTLEEYDLEIVQHMERTAMYALALARRFNFEPKDKEMVYLAAFVHDIGKIHIPLEILHKSEELTPDELNLVRENIFYGSNLIEFKKDFSEVAKYITTHQERFDGTGYKGLKGEEIPLFSRITHLADAYDAMRYVKGMKHQDAIVEMRTNAGTQFDPELVEPFIRAIVKEKLLNFDIVLD